MAVILTSSTQTAEEMQDALLANGLTAEGVPAPADSKPADDKKPSEKSDTPGETAAATKDDESGTVSETVDKDSQGKPVEAPQVSKAKEGAPSRSNFKTKLEKQQELTDRLRQDLELERGDKESLKAKLREAEEKLAAMPGSATPAADPKVPSAPVRPKFSDFDFDHDKYEAAMEKYEGEKSAYDEAKLLKKIADETATRETEQRENAVKAAFQKEMDDYGDRLETGKSNYPDWDEVFEALADDPITLPPALERSVIESENPADLLYYLMTNPDKVSEWSKLTPRQMVLKADQVERELVAARSKKPAEAKPAEKPAEKAPVAEAKPVETAAPVAAPAKPRDPREDPISRVGAHSASTTTSLAAATSPSEYIRLRRQGVKQ